MTGLFSLFKTKLWITGSYLLCPTISPTLFCYLAPLYLSSAFFFSLVSQHYWSLKFVFTLKKTNRIFSFRLFLLSCFKWVCLNWVSHGWGERKGKPLPGRSTSRKPEGPSDTLTACHEWRVICTNFRTNKSTCQKKKTWKSRCPTAQLKRNCRWWNSVGWRITAVRKKRLQEIWRLAWLLLLTCSV